MKGLRRYAHTLRHLKPWQVVGRIAAPLRRRQAVWRVQETPSDLRLIGRAHTAFPAHAPWNTRSDVLAGRFCFLNETADLGRPVDWRAGERPLLWQFNLHYFHYLHLVEPEEQVALCREWIGSNPIGRGVGWHPYPTALRIVNWCRAELTASDCLRSLYQQAAYLHRNVETHIYGNHLLENARALVLAGCYLRGQGEADAWLEHGVSIYRRETDEQVLSDGLHFERSPMYHALMLEGYLDVLNVLPDGHADRPWLAETARAMTDALAGVTHPDGQIALFNDSTFEIAPSPVALLDYANRVLGHTPQPTLVFVEAGYFVYDGEDAWLMVDAGPGGPDYLMAHAHADVFSYELSLGGHRFIVDTGVYEYAAGDMRQYVRRTAAHNTVEVDDTDQMECWDSFRVGRRAEPHEVVWKPSSRGVEFKGTFAGYEELIGDNIRHTRRLTLDETQRTLIIEDEIEGEGWHQVSSRIHLHPEVTAQKQSGTWRLSRNGVACTLSMDGAEVKLEGAWYCPQFGTRRKNHVLVLRSSGVLPKLIRYAIRY